MADIKITTSSVVRETLTGNPLVSPPLLDTASVVRETLTGDPLGPQPAVAVGSVVRESLVSILDGTPPHVASLVRETLTSDPLQPPRPVEVMSVVRETLIGDEIPGPLNAAGVSGVVREALIAAPPFSFSSVVRESLVSMVDSLTLQRIVPAFWQDALVPRPPMPHPSTVQSYRDTVVLREIVTVQRERAAPYSESIVSKLAVSFTIARPPAREEDMRSPIRNARLVWSCVLSRGKTYVPVSEVVTSVLRAQFVQRVDKLPAPQVRTPIQMGKVVRQIIQSRNASDVVITTEAHVATEVQQVVQLREVVEYRSRIDAARLDYSIVQQRTVTPPGIDDRAASLAQVVVTARDPAPPPFGSDHVASYREVVTQLRNPAAPAFSTTRVPVMTEAAVIRRDTLHPSQALGRHVSKLRRMSVHQVSKLPPSDYRTPIQTKTMRRMTVLATNPPTHQRSITRVPSLRFAFVFGKDFPLPWDVIDPAIGRHVGLLGAMTVQHRVTIPPETISKESRYAYNVLQRVVIGDKFPPPDYPEPVVPETFVNLVAEAVVQQDDRGELGAISAVVAPGVHGVVAVGDADGWIDPTIPASELLVEHLAQSVAHGDTFPDPALPQSDAQVAGLSMVSVVVDSTMPDPAIPQSEIETMAVIEFAAVGDSDLPDPTIPLSDLTVQRVGAFLAAHDPSLTGQFGMSEISSPSVVQFYVTRDPTMKGIPLRQGPRPVVSVTIS